MQQRQLRLGDILDDYCPRERRVTNHAIVAMVGPDVKQTRCTTCDAEHAFKHAKVPRQRRKLDASAAAPAPPGAPKRVMHGSDADESVAAASQEATMPLAPPVDLPADEPAIGDAGQEMTGLEAQRDAPDSESTGPGSRNEERLPELEEGPVHRPLIRATLPRADGQAPAARPVPQFTIRQPGGGNRFRPRHSRAGQQPHGSRWGVTGTRSGSSPGGASRPGGGRPQPPSSRLLKRNRTGHKRSK
jgi:hypothetical protein